MKVTVGTDIIEVQRVKDALTDSNFAVRVFTQKEIDYCESKNAMKYQHYAARFAAKEAVFKAISKNIVNKYDISWKDIEILNDENGRPFAKFNQIFISNIEVDVSISHIKEYALATAVVSASD